MRALHAPRGLQQAPHDARPRSCPRAAAAGGPQQPAAPAAAAVAPAEGAAAPPPPLRLEITTAQSIEEVGREAWDACALAGEERNPFVSYAFLHALEASGSAARRAGWLPLHVLVRDGATQALLAACPLYMKGHSYGEYVFDQSWAGAYQQATGANYYPKLQSCVPFTPVPGPRLLAAPGADGRAAQLALAESLPAVAQQLGVSSLHITFGTRDEAEALTRLGDGGTYLQRTGIQYHWHNRGYSSFDDFLMALRQSKRKNVRQERKRASEGLRVRRLAGADLRPRHWDAFYRFYLGTCDRRWGTAYLTREFFHRLGEEMAGSVLLVVAEEESPGGGGRLVAGALNLAGSHALFGRNWGCLPGHSQRHLHFELCYYQAVEHAIEAGLQRVEAGAQGEHKIARGYLPELTYSLHHIPDPGFRSVVDGFLRYERAEIGRELEALHALASPYRDRP